ncbi:restriction endonuclease subunit S [Candidatus Liberibacter brunswickensis]|uniref:restriction endonuclease subunit S n=1 Tax=Candidatus Liberibacter brunswickensis TaxID=1968796 RepID=UPI002FDFC039
MNKQKNGLVPELRFPEFLNNPHWKIFYSSQLFREISNKKHNSSLPILAITQKYGAIPREMIDYNISVTEKSIKSYKVVDVGDFIISLRSFQGGIEFSEYKGLCSPAYVVLRNEKGISQGFFKYYFKTQFFIKGFTKNLEGLRDGKMIRYSQFSETLLPTPSLEEQQKIADCLFSIDELITSQVQKLKYLKAHRKSLTQQLFPVINGLVPELRFPEFIEHGKSEIECKELGEVFLIRGGYTPSTTNPYFWRDGTIPFFLLEDIRKNGRILDDSLQHITREAVKNSDLFPANSIIISTSATVGEHALITVQHLANNRYISIALHDNFIKRLDMKFVFYYFFIICKLCKENIQNGSKFPTFPTSLLKKFPIPIPSLSEQKKIVHCLTALDDIINGDEQKLKCLKAHKRWLIQQLFPVIK